MDDKAAYRNADSKSPVCEMHQMLQCTVLAGHDRPCRLWHACVLQLHTALIAAHKLWVEFQSTIGLQKCTRQRIAASSMAYKQQWLMRSLPACQG